VKKCDDRKEMKRRRIRQSRKRDEKVAEENKKKIE
jgi:hypothetical protein